MPDTPTLPAPKFIHPGLAADEFRKILCAVEDEAYGGMTLPCDPHDRLIAINTMHNVFDRLRDAVERHAHALEKGV